MESTGSSSDAVLKLLRELLLAELRRHGSHRRDAYWLSSEIWDWEWLAEPPTFVCRVPALDSYRRFTVRIELPGRGQPLRVRCSCLPPAAGGSPFPHARRCRHTCAALMYLESQLLRGDRPADQRMVEFSGEELEAWTSTASILDGFLAEQAAAACPVDRRRRLTWRVRRHTYGIELGAWEQRLSGRGWTRGRKVSWERLARDRALWTREVDRHAVTKIFLVPEVPGDFSSLAPNWSIDSIAALRALAGHSTLDPLIFRWEAPEEPVAVETAELSLRLRPAGDGPDADPDLVLEFALGDRPLAGFAPTDLFENEETLVGFVDGGERILVAAAGARLLDLAARLGRGSRRIAAAEREAILGRLSELRQVPLTLAPELMTEAGPAEACPRLLLTPTEQGLSIGIRVRPGPGIVHLRPSEGRERLHVLEDGRFRVALRQLDAERRAARDLAARLGLGDSRSWDWLLAGDEAFDLIRTAQEEAARGLVVEWPEGDRQRVRGRLLPSDLRVKIGGHDWFAVRGRVWIGDEELSLAELLAALKSGRRYVPLESGGWVEITAELRSCLETLDDAVRPRRGALEVDSTAVPLMLQLLETSEVSCKVTARFRELVDRLREARRLDPVPPAELTATLRSYQLEGYRWLRRLAAWEMGGCLADDMGLGKTVQALALLLDRRNRGPALVVAPTSVGFNWLRETRRFAPALSAIAYHGPGRSRLLEGLRQGDLVITSYTLLRRDASRLAAVEWGTLVLDEAQAIKNSQTKAAQAARQIKAEWRLALTGTPLENHLGELWSLFRTLSPGLFGSWEEFRVRFAEPIEKYGDEARRRALARRVQPFILRRTKSEVLSELPERTDVELFVELSPGERRLYEAARLAALAELADHRKSRARRRFEILAALTRLRQLTCHPALVEPSWTGGSAKLDLAVRTIVELRQSGHRALVFSQFTRYLAILRKILDRRRIRHLYLDGSTSRRDRQRRIDAFQSGEGDVFLISLKAGGTGLNLTAADYVIHLDPWWNPAVEDQASDRAHRIGQTHPVTVYRLITRGTVEEEILKLQERKRGLVAGVLEGTDRAGRLSTDELIRLIQGKGE